MDRPLLTSVSQLLFASILILSLVLWIPYLLHNDAQMGSHRVVSASRSSTLYNLYDSVSANTSKSNTIGSNTIRSNAGTSSIGLLETTLSKTSSVITAPSLVPFADCAPDWYWCTDHETGTMDEWEFGQGQAVFNNVTLPGSSEATISDEQAHSGNYSLRLEVTGATGGQTQAVRVFRRWLPGEDVGSVVELPDEAYYSAWYYFPELVIPNLWWNLFQFKSKPINDPTADSEPMFTIHAIDHAPGEISLYVANKVGGSDNTINYYQRHPRAIPIGEWVHFEAYLKKSDGFGGQLLFWQNGELIFERTNIQTIDAQENRLQWSVNNYSDDLAPADVVIYVDDAVVSATQVSRDFPVLAEQPACSIYQTTSVPKDLPIGNTWNRSYLTVEGDGGASESSNLIEDLNVSLNIEHAQIADLTVLLEHEDSGVSAVLIDRPGSLDGGCLNPDVAAMMTDDANVSAEFQCASTAPTLNGELKPITPLSVFNGLSASGRWVLTIEDAEPSTNPGALIDWHLESCPIEERSNESETDPTTAAELSCTTYMASSEPTGMSFGNPWIRNSLAIDSDVSIADVNATVALSRTAIGELTVALSHAESNTNVLLLERPGRPHSEEGCGASDLSAIFDDDAQQIGEDSCAETGPAIAGLVQPHSPLQAFHDVNASGTWMLTVEAAHPSTEVGALTDWGIEICHITSPEDPAPEDPAPEDPTQEEPAPEDPTQEEPQINERTGEAPQLFLPFLSQ